MKLKTLILNNFRAYAEETRIDFTNFSVFIGKNDVGKSTILEALEIFFNNTLVKIECEDLSVRAKEKEVIIGCEFIDLPQEIVLDATVSTSLGNEYLLNDRGSLEIQKVYDCSGKKPKEVTYAFANHPANKSCSDLLTLKIGELKKRLEDLKIDTEGVDLRSSVSIRKTIWSNFSDLTFELTRIPLDKGDDAKRIWDKLEKRMPIFALFQADRPSKDDDAEVQDPMKLAIAEAVKSVETELDNIKAKVREKATEAAKRTLDKLRDMSPELAKELLPRFKIEPKWDTIFKLSLTGEDEIPINKRGSGVRRLILLNFFRGEVERRQREANSPGIIYAFEEPETSQHPSNQRILLDALLELSEHDNCQIIITTHVPGLAGLVPLDSIRYIQRLDRERKNKIHIADEGILKVIADDLGILPDKRVKLLICLEGPNDISFFKNISILLSGHYADIPNLQNDPRIAFLPLGGSTLKQWVDKQYLKGLGLPEIHIYDRDSRISPQYREICKQVNERLDNSWATLTQKRELENYLHPHAISKLYDVVVDFGDDDDVPMLVAKAVHERDSASKEWTESECEKNEKKEQKAKKRLNEEAVKFMTISMLEERGGLEEVKSWFKEIAKRL